LRRLTSRTGPARLSRRAVFHVDGRSFGAVITSDKDGYTAEATDLPALWSFAPTLDAALADLARLVSARLGTDALPTWHTNPLDRRPDLRARFSRVVARALARAVDLTPTRPIQARGVDGDAAEA
jgi:hypothetical protein